MSDTVIQVASLGKKFRRGERPAYARFSELLVGYARDGARWAKDRTLGLFARGNGAAVELGEQEFWALKDVSFDVKRGEVLGIIGRNGAGKSTLLKLLSRITQPTTGEIRLRGRVGSLLEVGTGFHPELTGRENIYLNGTILGMRKAEIDRKFDEIVAFAEIEAFLDTPVKHYSSGMYTRLAFAVAAHLEPEILLVDEVLAVGDVEFQKKCLGKMGEVARGGRTVLFVSHNMSAIERLCQCSLLLDCGRAVAYGATRGIVARYLAAAPGTSRNEELLHRQDRSGSGVMRFLASECLDSSGRRVASFRSGEDATIRLHYARTPSTMPAKIMLALGIDETLGGRVAHLSNELVGESLVAQGSSSGWIDVTLRRLPLVPGRYEVTIYAVLGSELSDWVRRAFAFHVDAGDFYSTGRLPEHGQGTLLIDHTFSISPITNAIEGLSA